MARPGPKLKTIEKQCKVCNKEFRARQRDIDAGKAKFCSKDCWVEHKRTDNAIVQLPCEGCGESFALYRSQATQARRFCSRECSAASQKITVTCKCKKCGSDFEAWSSKANGEKKAKFCSRACSSKGQGHKKRPPPKRFVCKTCGHVFLEKMGRERKYCSNKCCAIALRKPDKDKAEKRGSDHSKWAIAVLKRDKKCLKCGATEKLQAHHIEHWRTCPEKRLDLDNGATLCAYCHHSQHPYIPLEKFLHLGGASVKHCVVCESAFVSRDKEQRACSRKCGGALSASRRKSKIRNSDRGAG
jgi:hypothetical protein